MDDLDLGLVLVALPCVGLVLAFSVCEMVQWLVGSDWRAYLGRRPSTSRILAYFDAHRHGRPIAWS